jgi:hypothetical protein
VTITFTPSTPPSGRFSAQELELLSFAAFLFFLFCALLLQHNTRQRCIIPQVPGHVMLTCAVVSSKDCSGNTVFISYTVSFVG